MWLLCPRASCVEGARGGAERRMARRARRWWPAEWRVLAYGLGLPSEAMKRCGWIFVVADFVDIVGLRDRGVGIGFALRL